MTRTLAITGAFVALTLVGATAFAQSKYERAQQHFEKGANLYFVGDYDQAIAEFEKAQALTPDPIILYNISLAHHKLGNVDAALAVARLASTMEGFSRDDALRNDARIVGLQIAMDARKLASEVEPAEPEPKLTVVEPAPEPEVSVEEEATPSRAFYADWSPWRWTAVGMVGAGVVMLGIAGIFELQAAKSVDAFEAAAASGDNKNFEFVGERLRRQQRVGRVFLYGGLFLGAAGATLWILDDRGVLGGETALFIGPREAGLHVRF